MPEARALNWLKSLKLGNDIASAKITEQVAEDQMHRRKGILSIIDLIIALGQRCIAFRRNQTKYTSHQIQNEIISLCENKIRARIVQEIAK